MPRGPVPIPQGTIYLGVATSIGSLQRDVFGWLELDNTGTELRPVNNAMAYGEQGIYVGATIAVPEPALPGGTLAIALLVLAKHARYRRRSTRPIALDTSR